jgi:hypothetical protein
MPSNPLFNNQVRADDNSTYSATVSLTHKIVAQLQGKSIKEQEEIIEGLLKLLDINLLAALAIAYATAPAPETSAKQ